MLKGKIKFELRDAQSGKIKERIEGNNYFTDAINSLLNKAPMGCDRRTLTANTQQLAMESEINIASSSLGGVLLFPDEVTAGTNTLYEPLTHQPTAYSRYGDRDGSDTKAGAFNNADSGDIKDENGKTIGFRFVHEWGSTYGNGNIKSICLTHKYGGEAYGRRAYTGDKTLLTMGSIGINCRYIGILGEYIYYWNRHSNLANGDEIRRIRRPCLEILINTPAFSNENSELVYTYSESGNARIGLSEADQKIYIMSGSGGTTKKLTTVDLSGITPSTTSTTLTFPTSIPLPQNRRFLAIVKRGNFLYFGKTIDEGNLIVSKVNLTNTADYNEITAPINNMYGDLQLLEDTGDIICGDIFAIDGQDNVIDFTARNTGNLALIIGKRIGVWQAVERLSTDSTRDDPLMWQICPNYMATKFILDTTVTKTASLTARLVYEVTHT